MIAFALAGLLALGSTAELPPIEPPPMPDFKTPVDYKAWYVRQTQVPPGENALDMYGVFLYATKDSPNATVAPEPKSPAASQLSALASQGTIWRVPANQALYEWMLQTEARYKDALADGASRPLYAPRPADGFMLLADITPPKLGNARAVGQMMFARSWVAVGDTFYTDPLIEAVRTNLAMARQIGLGPTIEEQFFAAGHRDFVYAQLIQALRSRVYTYEVWERVADTMKAEDAMSVPQAYARSLYFAEARALQLLQHFCTDFLPGGGQELSPTVKISPVNAYFGSRYDSPTKYPDGVKVLAAADPVALAQAVHAYYEGMRSILTSPAASDLKKRTEEINKATFGKYPALSAVVMPIDLSIPSVFETEARRRMAYMFIRKAILFKKTNKWPAEFEGIDPADLEKYRTDPFTGRDFLFAKRRDRTAFYSPGPDGIDNGGNGLSDVIYWTVVMHDSSNIGGLDAPVPDGGKGKPNESDKKEEPAPAAESIPAVPAEEPPAKDGEKTSPETPKDAPAE